MLIIGLFVMLKNFHYGLDFNYFECGKIWHVSYKLGWKDLS